MKIEKEELIKEREELIKEREELKKEREELKKERTELFRLLGSKRLFILFLETLTKLNS